MLFMHPILFLQPLNGICYIFVRGSNSKPVTIQSVAQVGDLLLYIAIISVNRVVEEHGCFKLIVFAVLTGFIRMESPVCKLDPGL